MSRKTQQNCIDFMKEALDYNSQFKISVWDFSGEPKNFIEKAEKQGLEFIERFNDDLIFRLKEAE